VPENGTIIRLEKDKPKIIDVVPTGRLGYDGTRMIPMQSQLVKDRAKLSFQGIICISVALDKSGKIIKNPLISMMGVTIGGEEQNHLEREMDRSIRQVVHNGYKNTDSLANEIKVAVRRVTNNWIGKKPPVNVHIYSS
jgi:ribonuclease J